MIDALGQGLGQFALAAQIACDGRRGAHRGHCVHDVIQIISRAAHARESGDVSGRLRRRGFSPKLVRVVFGCFEHPIPPPVFTGRGEWFKCFGNRQPLLTTAYSPFTAANVLIAGKRLRNPRKPPRFLSGSVRYPSASGLAGSRPRPGTMCAQSRYPAPSKGRRRSGSARLSDTRSSISSACL